MAWTSPPTWVASQVPTAAELNAAFYYNMLETEAAKATGPGHVFTQNTSSARVVQSKFYSGTADKPNLKYTAATDDPFIIREPFVTVPRAASYLMWYSARQHRTAGTGSVFFMPVTQEGGFSNTFKMYSRDNNTNRLSGMCRFNLAAVSDLSQTSYTFGLGYGGTVADTAGWWAQRTLLILPIGAY